MDQNRDTIRELDGDLQPHLRSCMDILTPRNLAKSEHVNGNGNSLR